MRQFIQCAEERGGERCMTFLNLTYNNVLWKGIKSSSPSHKVTPCNAAMASVSLDYQTRKCQLSKLKLSGSSLAVRTLANFSLPAKLIHLYMCACYKGLLTAVILYDCFSVQNSVQPTYVIKYPLY